MLFKFNYAKSVLYAKNHSNKKNYFYKVFEGNDESVNFVSQCIFAGCENFKSNSCKDWFYENENCYSESWVDSQKLLSFLLNRSTCGPFGRIEKVQGVSAGDVIFDVKDEEKTVYGLVSRMENGEIFYISSQFGLGEKVLKAEELMGKIFIHILGLNK